MIELQKLKKPSRSSPSKKKDALWASQRCITPEPKATCFCLTKVLVIIKCHPCAWAWTRQPAPASPRLASRLRDKLGTSRIESAPSTTLILSFLCLKRKANRSESADSCIQANSHSSNTSSKRDFSLRHQTRRLGRRRSGPCKNLKPECH